MTTDAPSPQNPLIRFLDKTGLTVYAAPPVFALFFLGFASGLPLALSFGSLSAWLAEDGVSRTAIGLFAAVGTPYSLKFLWAPLMDRIPLPGLGRLFGRRRGWILLTQALIILAILAVGASDPGTNPGQVALFAVALAFASASQDIVIDAFRIESLTEDQQAAGASATVFGYRVAMVVSGAGALLLADQYSWAVAYQVMAVVMLVGVVTVLLRPEPEQRKSEDEEEREGQLQTFMAARPQLPKWLGELTGFLYLGVVAPFAQFMTRQGWVLILAFVVFFKFGDTLAGVMTMPFFLDLGFSKTEVAAVAKAFGFAMTMTGFALGGMVMAKLGMVKALWIAGILQMVSNLMFAVQAMVGYDLTMLAATIGFENLAGGLGTAVFVAYLSSLCNISYTATQYALLSSFMAAARTWLSTSAGWMAETFDWTVFFLTTTVAAVPGLILLYLVTRRSEKQAPQAAV